MKKILALSLVSVLVLSGCIFSGKDKSIKKAPNGEVNGTVAPAETISASVPKQSPPSFADGDIYLKAVASGDAKDCSGIVDNKLKTRCETEVGKQK